MTYVIRDETGRFYAGQHKMRTCADNIVERPIFERDIIRAVEFESATKAALEMVLMQNVYSDMCFSIQSVRSI